MTSVLAGLRVLLVDRDAAITKVLRLHLVRAGCEVRIAANADEALALAAVFAPEVVLLDLVLPGMSGLLLARFLRAAPETRGSALIAVTALAGEGVERIAREAGCDRFVTKPMGWSELQSVMAGAAGARDKGEA